jgi:fimbrial isopeptide formation D2 family protein/uncharacterized repeat protein (TIGR02543 family)
VSQYSAFRIEDVFPTNALSYTTNSDNFKLTQNGTELNDITETYEAGVEPGKDKVSIKLNSGFVAGGNIVLTLTFTVKDPAPQEFYNTAYFYPIDKNGDDGDPTEDTARTPALPDVDGFTKDAREDAYLPGGTLTYDINFKVPSAENLVKYDQIRIEDVYPDELTYIDSETVVKIGEDVVSLSGEAGFDSDTGNDTISFKFPSSMLTGKSGQVVTITLTFDVDDTAEGILTNHANLYPTPKDGTEPGNPTDSREETVDDLDDVTDFSKDAKQDAYVPGDIIRYDISFTLPSNADLENYKQIRIEDAYPTELTYRPADTVVKIGSATVTPTVTTETGAVSFILDSTQLKNKGDQIVTVSLAFDVDDDATGSLNNTASFYPTPKNGEEPDDSTEDDTEEIEKLPDVENFAKDGVENYYIPGKPLSYEIKFKLPADVSKFGSIEIEDDYDDLLTYSSYKLTIGGQEKTAEITNNGTVNAVISGTDLLGGAEVILTLTFNVKSNASGSITNKASYYPVPKNGEKPEEPEEEVPANPVPELPGVTGFSKNASKTNYTPGEELSYDISFTLPSDVSGYDFIRIVDEFPSTLTYTGDYTLMIDGTSVSIQPDDSVPGKLSVTIPVAELTGHENKPVKLTLKFTVVSNATGNITNTARLFVTPVGDDEVPDPIPPVPETVPPATPVPPVGPFTVTYNGNGNTSGSAPVDSDSPYVSESNVTVMSKGSLYRNNYDFEGWSLNSNANRADSAYDPGDRFGITGNITLYAIWDRDNGGGGNRPEDPTEDETEGETEGETEESTQRPTETPSDPSDPTDQSSPRNPTDPPEDDPGDDPEDVPEDHRDPVRTDNGESGAPAEESTTQSSSMQDITGFIAASVPQPLPIVDGFNGFLADLFDDEIPTLDIFDDPVPLFGTPGEMAWALVNLLLAILGGGLAAVTAVRAFLKRKREQEDEKQNNNQRVDFRKDEADQDEDAQRKYSIPLLIGTGALAVVGVLLFQFTEDMSQPMVLIDVWTIWNLVLAVAVIVAIQFVFLKAVVLFELGGTGDSFQKKIHFGKQLREPNVPKRESHSFAGWFTDKDSGIRWNFKNKVQRSFTLYAKWNEVPAGEKTVTDNASESGILGK